MQNCCRAVHTFDCLSVQTNCCNAGAVAVNLSAFDIDAVRAVILQLGGMQIAVCALHHGMHQVSSGRKVQGLRSSTDSCDCAGGLDKGVADHVLHHCGIFLFLQQQHHESVQLGDHAVCGASL